MLTYITLKFVITYIEISFCCFFSFISSINFYCNSTLLIFIPGVVPNFPLCESVPLISLGWQVPRKTNQDCRRSTYGCEDISWCRSLQLQREKVTNGTFFRPYPGDVILFLLLIYFFIILLLINFECLSFFSFTLDSYRNGDPVMLVYWRPITIALNR